MSLFRHFPILLVSFAGFSPAQTVPPAAPPAAPGTEKIQHLDKFVVSAGHDSKTLFDLAQGTSVLAGEELHRLAQSTLGETLNGVPGVSSTSYGPGASRPVIRGLGGDRVRVLDNGVGSLDASSVSPDHNTALEPLFASRIEVLRGPSTLLYGSSAIGGAVNVIDNAIPGTAPDGRTTGALELRGGGAARERAAVVSVGGGEKSFAAHLNALQQKSDDLHIPGVARIDAGAPVNQPRGLLPGSDGATFSGSLGAGLFWSAGRAGAALAYYDTDYGVPNGEDIRIRMRQTRLDLEGEVTQPFGVWRSAKVRVGLGDYTHAELGDGGRTVNTRFNNRAGEGRVELPHVAIGDVTGTIGAQAARSDFAALGAEVVTPPSLTQSAAIFALEEMKLGSKATLQAGARYEVQQIGLGDVDPALPRVPGYAARSGQVKRSGGLSGSLGLVVYPVKDWSVGASLASSERLPTAQELFANGPHGGTGAYEIGTSGLGRLVNDRIEPVADDPVLRENQIILLEPETDGNLGLLTAKRGFFRLAHGQIAPLATGANRWLAGKQIHRALRLTDGSLVVGFSATSGDGGMRFAPDGRFLSPIDTSIGLLAKTLRGFFRDREGGLWIGMETGSARLEWPSTLSLFDSVNGLGQGAVAAVTRHDGVIYAATGEGLFRLVPADEAGRTAHFERIFNRPVSALASHPAGLLALSFGGVLTQTQDGFSPVARLSSEGGVLLRSKRDPERIWVGTTRELRSLHHGPNGWNDEGPVPGFAENCRALSEATDGALWVATIDHGFFRLDVAGEKRNAPQVERHAGGPGVAEPLGADVAAGWAGDAIVTANREAQRLPHLVLATLGTVHQRYEENGPDGAVLWVAGANGLARIETTPAIPPSVPFATQLHARTLHDGDRLPPEHGPITFEFLAPRQRPTSAVSYQTRLVGLEREWSEWSIKRTRDFSRLPPGRYRFSVRARDAEGIVTPPAEIGFAVLPPWWATAWAIAGYAAVGLGVIAGVVQTRTRALRRRAEHLEGVVTQRTAELAQRNLELIRLHRLELDEKISARLAEEKARLEVLRYQLNPHFLFNTLASISASLPEGRSTARTMVERLADFCRLTLHRSDDRDWTTLGEELELLRAYLEIEQSRWSDLLSITLASDPALDAERIPHFLLLPLVENALKYGRATSQERVGFRLTTRREPDGAMVFEVSNTGEWIEPTGKRSTSSLGIGLENLRERLLRYFPRQHQLTFSHVNGWVTVTLRLAIRHTRSMEPIPTDRRAPPPAGSP